jgi:hypothetical protein
MRTTVSLTVALLLVTTARADDQARGIIEKAIEAHGGATVLDKYPAGVAKSKGTIALKGTDYPFTLERVFFAPNKLRITSEVVIMNIHRPVTCAVVGNSVTAVAGGLAQELPKPQVEELRTALYVQNVIRLTPLLKDKPFKLSAAGEKKIEGQSAIGVTVSSEGHKDVRLYFDKQTNLLVAVERSGFDDGGKPVEHTEIYGSYREANGLKYPTKTLVKQNGKRYLESETIEFKPLEKVESREFQIIPS